MTENPIIPSPPGPSQPPSLANSTTAPEDAADSSGEIDCICEISDDDGYTICCDKCDTWQHLVCVQLTGGSVPSEYYCPRCSPRPLDVQKAKEIQRQRRVEEQAKKSHKKKRPPTTSRGKKELTNGSNGITSTKVLPMEKAGALVLGKPVSPREMQQPPTRKRTHRASTQPNNNSLGSNTPVHHTAILLNNVPGVTASPGSPNVPFSSRNGETESDTDPEKPAKYLRDGFTDMGSSPDKYASADVQRYVQSLVMTPSNLDSTSSEWQVYYYRSDLFSLGLPKASSQVLPGSLDLRSEHPRRRLLLTVGCSEGDLIAIYKGEVGYQDSYKRDRTNQYSDCGHPKPCVLFHPNLPICVDARRYGTESRFVRRSCRPNLALKTIIIDRSEICFGLFANQALKLGTELTVSWDWSGELSRRFVKEGFDVRRLSAEYLKELAAWVHQLTLKMGDCACSEDRDCLLSQIKKTASDSCPGKPLGLNGNSRKPRRATAPVDTVAASVVLKQPGPEQQSVLLKKEEDDESRSVSPPLSRSKPRSRDLTPSMLQDTAVEAGEMTRREARKLKELLSRIEKQEQEEQQSQPLKRRKRNSTVSLAGTLPLHSPGIESKDGMKGTDASKRQKLPSNQRSPSSPVTPGSSHVSGEYMVADASVGRRASDSPISSDEKRNHKISFSPIGPQAQAMDISKHNGKAGVRPLRLQYQDKAIQTETIDEEVPWWSPSARNPPPRAPRLPLRKRLMQSLLRDRGEVASITSEDKKRKHDTVSDDPESSPSSKVPKLSSSGSVRSLPLESKRSLDTPPSAITSPAPPSGLPLIQTSTVQDPTVIAPDPNIVKPPPQPPGPPLADLFSSNSEKPSPSQPSAPFSQATQPLDQPQSSARQDRPHVNDFRTTSLQVQLPPGLGVSNGPPTPAIQGSQPSASGTAPVQRSLAIIPGLVSPSVSAMSNSMVQPSPTRRKKMSLEDYGKRKHKADSADKGDDKAAAKLGVESPAVSTTPMKTGGVSTVVEQPQSIAEPSSVALHRVSTGPKE